MVCCIHSPGTLQSTTPAAVTVLCARAASKVQCHPQEESCPPGGRDRKEDKRRTEHAPAGERGAWWGTAETDTGQRGRAGVSWAQTLCSSLWDVPSRE